ncbi:MAG: hypothetical protein Q9197_004182 [Variospora fuerteventurae]
MHPERSVLLAVCIVLPVLALVSVFLRFAARSSRKLPLLVDDWTALIALVTPDVRPCLSSDGSFLQVVNIASSIVAVYAVKERGFGLAPKLFRPQDLVPAFKVRALGRTTIIAAITVLIAIQALTSWTIPQFWNTKVIDYRAFNIAMAVLDLVLDILILLLPIQPVSRLQIGRREKCAVIAIFWLGSFCIIASALRIYYTYEFLREKPNVSTDWKTSAQDIATSNALWLAVESNMSVIAACLPTLGAHFRSRLGLSADRSRSKAYSLRMRRIAGLFDQTLHPRTTSSASTEARTPWVPLQEHPPKAMIDHGVPKDGGNAYRSHPRSGIMVDRTFDLEHAVVDGNGRR